MSSLKHDRQHDEEHYRALNDFLDGIAEGEEKEAMGAHLSACTDCERLLKELRSLRREAKALPGMEPPEEAWSAIAAKLESSGAEEGRAKDERRTTGSQSWAPWVRLLATAAVLALGFALGQIYRANQGPPATDPDVLVSQVAEDLRLAESHYRNAIEGLERIVQQNEGELPPELTAVLDENLTLIESAIAESRSALATQPESKVAQESLLEALRRKVSLLQNTILLINEVRKGEGETALELIDELRDTQETPNQI